MPHEWKKVLQVHKIELLFVAGISRIDSITTNHFPKLNLLWGMSYLMMNVKLF